MNAEEKLEFEQKAGRYVSAMGNPDEQLFLDSLYNINRAEIARGVNTYWLGEPVRTAVTHKHNIYAEGGDEAIRYGLGFTYNRTNRGDGTITERVDRELILILTYRKGLLLSVIKCLTIIINKRIPLCRLQISRKPILIIEKMRETEK